MFDTITLDNGLRVVVNPLPYTRAVSIQVAVGVGFGHEAPHEAGISHFVEHMLFKGTSNRPSFAEITGFIETLGGVMNAGTDKEMTSYFVKVPAEHFQAGLELLADVIMNSAFSPEEVERERKIIVDEVAMARDAPEDWCVQLFDALMWPDHGVGRPVSDGEPVLRKARIPVLRKHVRQHYCARNMVVSVAGGVGMREAVQAVAGVFGPLRAGRRSRWPAVPPGPSPRRMATESRDTLQVSLVVGARTFFQDDPDRPALEILNAVLGEGMCSRLFAEIRERRALTYDVFSYLSQLRDTGSIAVSASVAEDDLLQTVEAIVGQCENLAAEPPTDWELERAREYVKGGLILGMEDSQNVAAWFAREELLEAERLTVEEVVRRLDLVTAEEVRRVAERVFSGHWQHVAAVGPVAEARALGKLIGERHIGRVHVA